MRSKIVGPTYVAQFYEVKKKKNAILWGQPKVKKVSVLHYSIDYEEL